jgi:hypothetical protein
MSQVASSTTRYGPRSVSWARKLKKVALQKQNSICKTRAQDAIALLNYLKRIAPQQLMLIMQVFIKKMFKRNEQYRKFVK